MKKLLYLAIISIFGLVVGCSELNKDLVTDVPSVSVHEEGIGSPESANFHGKLIQKNNWNMKTCQQCHASDYSGGTAFAASKNEMAKCITCHTSSKGPEACNTCHGDMGDPSVIYPTKGFDGTTRGVGAHQLHLEDSTYSKVVDCKTCHVVPTSLSSAGHIDNTGYAEVIFSDSIKTLASNISYTASNLTCANTYCHGNFKFRKAGSSYAFMYTDSVMAGNNKSMEWKVPTDKSSLCGSCHDLPPKGHTASPLSACAGCHIGVINSNGEIIDRSKHINGKANVFGN